MGAIFSSLLPYLVKFCNFLSPLYASFDAPFLARLAEHTQQRALRYTSFIDCCSVYVLLLPLLFLLSLLLLLPLFLHFRGSNLKRTFVRSRSDFKLAIVPVIDSGKTNAWTNFKNGVKDFVSGIYNSAPVQNFISEWVKPAAHDAKETVANMSNKMDTIANPVISNLAHDAKESLANVKVPTGSFNYSGGSSGSSYSSVVPAANSGLNYLHADLAAHYGMDTKAAYSEALQNTAYQRAVADLKRAGLNPVLAVNGMSPAGSYAAGNTLAGASGSGSSGGYRSGNSGRRYAFDSDTYNLIGVAGTVVGAVTGMVASPKAPVLGASTGAMLGKQLTQSIAQALSSASRR